MLLNDLWELAPHRRVITRRVSAHQVLFFASLYLRIPAYTTTPGWAFSPPTVRFVFLQPRRPLRCLRCLMLQEGAVEAVLKLCKTDHLLLRGYCSAVLKHFGATPVLREKLVARGGVSKYALAFLIAKTRQKYACSISLKRSLFI